MSRGTGIDAAAFAFMANLLIVVTVVCSAALAAARFLYRRNPAARHFVCLAGIAGVLLAPITVLAISHTSFGFEAMRLTWAPAKTQPIYLIAARRIVVRGYRPASHSSVYAQPRDFRRSSFVWWILAVWFAGSVCGALRLAHGLREARRYRRMANIIHPQRLQSVLPDLECADHIWFPPILTSQAVRTPMAAGILRPVVILPDQLLETLTPIQLRHVLAHELTHIRLRHGISGFAQRLAGLLFWPHPLVRALCAALSAAREEICDSVASQDDGAACYARTLLAVAEQIRCAPAAMSSGLAFLGPGTSLEDRIAGLLDPRRIKQVELEPSKIWAVTGALVVTILGAAAFRVKSVDRQDRPNPIMTASRSGQSVDIATPSSMPDAYDLSPTAPHVNINPPRENVLIKRLIGVGKDTIEVRAGTTPDGRPHWYVYRNGVRLDEPFMRDPRSDPGFGSGSSSLDGQLSASEEPAATQMAQVMADDSDSQQAGPNYLAMAGGARVRTDLSAIVENLSASPSNDIQIKGNLIQLSNNDIDIQLKAALDDIQSSRDSGDSAISVDGGIETDTGTGTGSDGGAEFLYKSNDASAVAPLNLSYTYTTTGDNIAQVLSTADLLQALGAVQNSESQRVVRWKVSKP